MSETVPGVLITATFLFLTAAIYFFLIEVWSDHSILFNEAAARQEQQVETSLDIADITLTDCPSYPGPYDAIVETLAAPLLTIFLRWMCW
jgi:hypothetical protein